MIILSDFSNNLKKFRITKNLSRSEMARELNITSAAYGAYELGKREPNYDTLLLIAKILNISVNELLGDISPTLTHEEILFNDIQDCINYINKNNLLPAKINLTLDSPLMGDGDDFMYKLSAHYDTEIFSIPLDDCFIMFRQSKAFTEKTARASLAYMLLNYLKPMTDKIDKKIHV